MAPHPEVVTALRTNRSRGFNVRVPLGAAQRRFLQREEFDADGQVTVTMRQDPALWSLSPVARVAQTAVPVRDYDVPSNRTLPML